MKSLLNKLGTYFINFMGVFSIISIVFAIMIAGVLLNDRYIDNIVYADSSPNYAVKDTVNAVRNNTLLFSTISNFSKWNVDSLTTAVIVDTLVLAQPSDKINDVGFQFQRMTGQIIINMSGTDSVLISFPGTDFFHVTGGKFTLNPAFHDTLFYKAPGTTLVKFQVLHTTLRTLR